jgi:DNA-nicking Smr family endonuclease
VIRRTRRGGLSETDVRLWAKVLAEVEPLPGRRPPAATQLSEPPAPAPSEPATRWAPTPSKRRSPPDLAAIEARLARRLARGTAAVDGRLDLHGLRQEAAHRRLIGFLMAAQQRGDRVVLIITGKGRVEVGSETPGAGPRGVLRRLVPLWLAEPGLRGLVIGFSEAAPSHGGAGALYVRLRRRR